MENKENFCFSYGLDKPIDIVLGNSTKHNLKSGSISSFASQLEMEKEYLAKLKVQRQKTERLHSEYTKLKKEKDKFKQDYEGQLLSAKSKLVECQNDLSKKTDQWRQLDRQIQRLRSQLDKLNREKNQNVNSLKFTYEQSLMNLSHDNDKLKESLESKNKQLNGLKKSHDSKITEIQNQKNQLQNNFKMSEQKYKQSEEKRKQSEKTVLDLNKRISDLNGQSSRLRNQLQTKALDLTTLRTNFQRIQLQHQTSIRRTNDLQKLISDLQQRLDEKQKEKQKMRIKLQQTQQKLKVQKQEKERVKIQQQQLKIQNEGLRYQINKKDQIIHQYSQKFLKRQDEDLWKQKLNQKQHQNEQLRELIRTLRESNDQLINFIKQKHILEKERRSIVENQMVQITKFENLLKDVR